MHWNFFLVVADRRKRNGNVSETGITREQSSIFNDSINNFCRLRGRLGSPLSIKI